MSNKKYNYNGFPAFKNQSVRYPSKQKLLHRYQHSKNQLISYFILKDAMKANICYSHTLIKTTTLSYVILSSISLNLCSFNGCF